MLSVLLAGCARSPEGAATLTIREISFRINFNGPINDNYFYFVVIDTSGGGDGPTPIFPGNTPTEGWFTGQENPDENTIINYYVQYHQRLYTLYKVTSLQPFRSEPIGAPTRSTLPEFGGSTLAFTIDINDPNAINATGDSVDINIIAVDDPLSDTRLIDGLGSLGTSFLAEVDILTDRTITNAGYGLIPEGPDDVLNQNIEVQPESDQTNPLDIIDWSITANV